MLRWEGLKQAFIALVRAMSVVVSSFDAEPTATL
jgi:hypothetical protein